MLKEINPISIDSILGLQTIIHEGLFLQFIVFIVSYIIDFQDSTYAEHLQHDLVPSLLCFCVSRMDTRFYV